MRKCLPMLLAAAALLLAACAHSPTMPNAGSTSSAIQGNGSGAQSAGAAGASSTESGGAKGAAASPAVTPSSLHRTIHFAFNSSVIDSTGTAIVAANAKYLVAHPSAHVRLEGNTDERGSPEYNIGLGWRRAEAVRQAMLLQGVSASQMTMVSYGAERPVDPAHNEAAWAKNRRVDIVYLN